MKDYFKRAYEWGKSTLKIFLKCNCAIHAAGLTYYSMLSIVPILCLLLIGSKMLGVHDIAKDKIHSQVNIFISELESAPEAGIAVIANQDEQTVNERKAAAKSIASEARELEQRIFSSLDKIDFETLGWIGFIMLLWTALSSIGMVEVSFNEIWETSQRRAMWKKILVNTVVVLVIPLLCALALTAPVFKIATDFVSSVFGSMWITKWLSDGVIWVLNTTAMRVVSTLLFSTAAFFLLFVFLPTCRVKFKYAWYAALLTAVVFGLWMKLCAFAQVGIARSSMLYGSLAILPILLAWMYISWQIVLFGCCALRATHICMYAQSKI